jgi:hypothetical protein
MNKNLMGVAIGALALGFIEKQAFNLPTLPVIGKKGTLAVGAYFLGGKNKPGLMRDICVAATVLAAHEFGEKGSISGDDDD